MSWRESVGGQMRNLGACVACRLIGVLMIAALAAGCVSRTAMKRMGDQLDYLEASQKRMERDLIRIDSLTSVSTETSRRTRADVASSLDELKGDAQAVRESVNELRQMIERRPTVVYQQPAVTPPVDTSQGAARPAGSTPPDINPSQLYENAFLDVRKGNYELAIAQFRDVLEYFGQSEYAPNARYWIGDCWYSLKQYDSAVVEFETLVTTFPQSDRMSTALYKLGRCYEEKGLPKKARHYYEQVVREYPNSLEAKPSQNRLGQLE